MDDIHDDMQQIIIRMENSVKFIDLMRRVDKLFSIYVIIPVHNYTEKMSDNYSTGMHTFV